MRSQPETSTSEQTQKQPRRRAGRRASLPAPPRGRGPAQPARAPRGRGTRGEKPLETKRPPRGARKTGQRPGSPAGPGARKSPQPRTARPALAWRKGGGRVPASRRVSMFCGRAASSATACTNCVRARWYCSKTAGGSAGARG